ncbi:MAG: ATP-binding cassette domain-containing protein [Lautropia sp.]|nr:ATP-binding cassette domain-containing protein [Lautropia sp.]
MSVLYSLIDASLAFGSHPLLDGAALTVTTGERLGLIGRNGTGKSSLLNVIAGRIMLDDGRQVRRDGLRVVLVEQEPKLPVADTLFDALLKRGVDSGSIDENDERRYWATQTRLRAEMSRFGIDPELDPAGLSGGQSKRAALALAFALEPELMLLDEPTNHLDIEGIESLEQVINAGPALVVITHDRRFLDQVATRIIELDRGLLRSFPGSFSTYEKVRGEQLEAETVANRRFDKFWAQEEVWIRKGIEARRTRNEGRVRRLEALRQARAARRERAGQIKLEVDAGERSGKLVCEMQQASLTLGGRCLVDRLDLTIMRGDRIGLIGPNGVGKSSLLKLILGEYPPDSGTVRLGSNLQVAYFDQLREQLDGERSVADTVSPGSDHVEINGTRRHIISYLQDLLFPPNRINSPVRMLSGGERNRLLLARLFARPANMLVLDEPTNDLDLESIDLLESMLQSYPGTLLLVSHDRRFLDNVVTSVLVARGGGSWLELVGGYSDWLNWRESRMEALSGGERSVMGEAAGTKGVAKNSAEKARGKGPGLASGPATEKGNDAGVDTGADKSAVESVDRKAGRSGGRLTLSNKESRELAELPGRIEALELEHEQAMATMSSAEFFRQDAVAIKAFQAKVAELEAQLAEMMARWEVLLDREAEVNASRGR